MMTPETEQMDQTRKDKKWKSEPRAIQRTPARVEHAKMKMEHALVKNSRDGVTERLCPLW
jgi:hypothetical protein